MRIEFTGGHPVLGRGQELELGRAAQRASRALFQFVRLSERCGAETAVSTIEFRCGDLIARVSIEERPQPGVTFP